MRKHGNGTIVGWRWRGNPLRRPSDAVEAWIVLATWALATAGGAAAGAVAVHSVGETIARDSAGRTPVSAVMVGTDPALKGVRLEYLPATVRWTEGTGTVRTGTTDVKAGTEAGDTVRVWSDGDGHLVAPPVGSAEATARGVLAGVWFAGATGLLVLATGRVVRLRVERRATERWGEEWDRAGREWGSTKG